eukprot:1707-Heterococcus_DN1.PRE.2
MALLLDMRRMKEVPEPLNNELGQSSSMDQAYNATEVVDENEEPPPTYTNPGGVVLPDASALDKQENTGAADADTAAHTDDVDASNSHGVVVGKAQYGSNGTVSVSLTGNNESKHRNSAIDTAILANALFASLAVVTAIFFGLLYYKKRHSTSSAAAGRYARVNTRGDTSAGIDMT